MVSKLDGVVISAKNRMRVMGEQFKLAVKDFYSDERGVAGMVVTILLIIIALALAAIFKDTLTEAAKTVMDQLTSFIEGGEE